MQRRKVCLKPTKYYENISKRMGVMACTRSTPKTHYGEIIMKGKKQVSSILHATCLFIQLHPYLMFLKDHKGHRSYGAHLILSYHPLLRKSSSLYNVKSKDVYSTHLEYH